MMWITITEKTRRNKKSEDYGTRNKSKWRGTARQDEENEGRRK
jgi:hypothetical protein